MAHTFVLVHGARHGGWCWRRVADHLRRDGHAVFTPTLTGRLGRQFLRAAADRDFHVADRAQRCARAGRAKDLHSRQRLSQSQF